MASDRIIKRHFIFFLSQIYIPKFPSSWNILSHCPRERKAIRSPILLFSIRWLLFMDNVSNLRDWQTGGRMDKRTAGGVWNLGSSVIKKISKQNIRFLARVIRVALILSILAKS